MVRKEKRRKKREGKKKCRESILIGMDERKSKFFVSYCLYCWWWCFLVFLFLPNCLHSFLLSLSICSSLSLCSYLCVYLLCSYDVTLANSSKVETVRRVERRKSVEEEEEQREREECTENDVVWCLFWIKLPHSPDFPSFSVTFTQNLIPLILVSISFLLFHSLILWLSVTPLFLSLFLSLSLSISFITTYSIWDSLIIIIFIITIYYLHPHQVGDEFNEIWSPSLWLVCTFQVRWQRERKRERRDKRRRERGWISFSWHFVEKGIYIVQWESNDWDERFKSRERKRGKNREERDKKWIAIENCTFNDGWKKYHNFLK